jgi:hypothetical protein
LVRRRPPKADPQQTIIFGYGNIGRKGRTMGVFFIELLLIVILSAVLWNRGREGIDTLLIALGAKNRRSEDVSDPPVPVPPELKFTVESLGKLGFQRLGEVQVALPRNRTSFSRLFVSKDRKIFADLNESRIVLFTSVFKDDAVAETGWPVGENFSRPDFLSRTVTTGLEDACRYQKERIAELAKTHGPARKIKSVADYQAWEALYRRRFVARKMRRHAILAFLELFLLGFNISALLAALVYWLGSDMSTIDPLIFITTVLVGVLAPAAILAFLIPFLGDWGSRRSAE